MKYTIINPDTHEETQILLDINEDHVLINGLAIDRQQLTELGMLLFSIGAKDADLDSCVELLDGFDIPVPTQELKFIANLGNG